MGGVLFLVSETFGENDPQADPTGSKTGTVGANVILFFNIASIFNFF